MSKNEIEYSVRVKDIKKNFKLPHERYSGIKQLIVNAYKRKSGYEMQRVLKGVTFDVKKGEFFGIVGRNGSGKSTLLKMLAGIYPVNSGTIEIRGKLTPFIELGVGFNPELTGRENVFLNGALLGFDRTEVEKMYDHIVEFAELEKFMDQKLKNYSSGMQVRLAFSIAIQAKSDILLLDEVLAVGDAEFQRKCYDYFMSLKEEKQTVILVTHDMGAVRQYCDRAILVENGKIVHSGSADDVAQEYQKLFSNAESVDSIVDDADRSEWGEGGVKIARPKIVVENDRIRIITEYTASKDLPSPIYGFTLFNSAGVNILEANTRKERLATTPLKKDQVFSIEWSFPNILSDGQFNISVACCDQSATRFYKWINNAAIFRVTKHEQTAGLTNPEIKATIITDKV
jgi:ABC-2 type transport system ATP-binding protein